MKDQHLQLHILIQLQQKCNNHHKIKIQIKQTTIHFWNMILQLLAINLLMMNKLDNLLDGKSSLRHLKLILQIFYYQDTTKMETNPPTTIRG